MTSTHTEIAADFEVTRWDTDPYLGPGPDGAGPAMSQVFVGKTFTGEMSGTSVARVLTVVSADGQGYVASERFEGSVAGRTGTLVYQHGGTTAGAVGSSFGTIVPGCGTGDLADLRGTIAFRHDDQGAGVTLVLE